MNITKVRTPVMNTQQMQSENGLTMIELILAMGISLIILGGLYFVFSTSNKTFQTQNEMVVVEQNLRGGLDYMMKEFRMAGYNNNTPGTRNINAITRVVLDGGGRAVEISFVWDRGNDGTMDVDSTCIVGAADEDIVTYSLDDDLMAGYVDANHTRLMRGVGAPNCAGFTLQPLADNIVGLTFSFFDSTGTAITPANAFALQTNRDTIRTIQISMTAGSQKIDTTRGGYRTHTMTGIVMPRNLGY